MEKVYAARTVLTKYRADVMLVAVNPVLEAMTMWCVVVIILALFVLSKQSRQEVRQCDRCGAMREYRRAWHLVPGTGAPGSEFSVLSHHYHCPVCDEEAARIAS